MLHVIVKMISGRTTDQKDKLTKAITDNLTKIVDCEERSVSVSIEEFSLDDWPEKVYRPYIMEKEETLVKKPGYNPFDSE